MDGTVRWTVGVCVAAALLGGGARAAEQATTFASELPLRVVVVTEPLLPNADADCLAGDLDAVGETPSLHALEVPGGVTWFVAPKSVRIGPAQARAIVAEAVAKGVPGLSFEGCEGVGDEVMGDIAGHAGLRYLDLRGTRVTVAGLRRLAKHPALRWLDIADRQPEDMTWLRGMPELVAVDLSGAWLTGGALEGPAAAPALETLVVRRASELAGGVLHPLRKAKSLRRLVLGENTNLRDGELKALASVPRLEHVELARCGVTDAGLAALADCKRLVSLDLTACGVTGSGLGDLAGARSLTRLVLRETRVGDARAPDLAALRRLRSLDLSDTAISDAGVAALAEHGALEELRLSDCGGVTEDAIPSLSKMKSLRLLDLDGTGIPRTRFREIERALPRCSVR